MIGKISLKNPHLSSNWTLKKEYHKSKKFKSIMLHFRAIEMCLFLVLFSVGFPAHEIPQSKVKKNAIYFHEINHLDHWFRRRKVEKVVIFPWNQLYGSPDKEVESSRKFQYFRWNRQFEPPIKRLKSRRLKKISIYSMKSIIWPLIKRLKGWKKQISSRF